MKKVWFALGTVLLLLFSPSVLAQADPGAAKAKNAPSYESAMLLTLTATGRTVPRETRHTTLTDSLIVYDKVVTYEFAVKSGMMEYTSRYSLTNEPGDLPHDWWQGNQPVQIRVRKHALFIKLPNGSEVRTQITGHAVTVK
jgi:hypothetical protein